MTPQIHDDKIQGEEQLPSPVEEKQKGRQWLMRILGVALPFVGGFVFSYPWWYEVNEFAFWMLFLGIWLTVFVGALLLRSWWSLLIVPVAAYVGIELGNVVYTLIQGGGPTMQEWIGNWIAGLGSSVMILFLPFIVIALIGTLLSNRFWRWWEMRKIRQQTKSLYMP